MSDPLNAHLTPRALRKLVRRLANERLAKQARFWTKAHSALHLDHDQPVNRQARKDLSKCR
jgi:hypothetical protein